jgi:MFS family permease
MRWRDFTLLWSASAASQLGGMCAATANPLLALVLTHSPVFAGYVGAASTIPALLMYLPAGWFVDRFNRRLLMFVSQLGRLAACGLVVYALGFGGHPKPLLITAALCEGTFLVLYSAAEITAVQRVVNSAELSSALAMNEARGHLAVMAGKPLGGFLFGQRESYPYFVNLVASLWSLVALLMMDKTNYQPEETRTPAGAAPRISLLDGLRMVILNSFLRTVVVVCAVGNFLFQTVLLLLVVLAEQQHLSSTRIGVLLATSGIGGLIGSAVAPSVGKHVRDERDIIKICVFAWATLTFVVAVSAQPVVGMIAWGGLSVTGGFLNVAIVNHQARRVPDHLLGRVIGINRFFTSGAVPLGALSAGYIVAELQPRLAAWLVFAVIAAMTVAVPLLIRPRRWLPAGAVERIKRRLAVEDPGTVPASSASSDLDGFAPVRATWSRGIISGQGTEAAAHAQTSQRVDTERAVLPVPVRRRGFRRSVAHRPRPPQDPYGPVRGVAHELLRHRDPL